MAMSSCLSHPILPRQRSVTPVCEDLACRGNISFDLTTFRRACEWFATFDHRYSDETSLYFDIEGSPLVLVVITEGYSDVVSRAMLEFHAWETFLEEEDDSHEAWQAERDEFDRVYAESLAAAIEVLGPPLLQGVDDDEDRLQHALWRGKTGLLILHQTNSYCESGRGVVYRVQRWSGSDPQPTSPFDDWVGNVL
jgi:hypothetical protein